MARLARDGMWLNICVIKKVSDVMWNKEEEVCGKADEVDKRHMMLNQK